MGWGDRSLLRDLAAGRTQAYEKAIEQCYERIYAFLCRLGRDATLAEDLTQETFAAAWRSLDRFEGRSSLSTWLHRVALNTFREHCRHSRQETQPLDEDAAPPSPDPAPELIRRLDEEQLQRKVQEAVDRLPDIYREAVILRCYQGLKYREVAELLDVPVGTVQYRLHIALEKLRTALREEVDGVETMA